MKALGLLSGGLDSVLAMKLILDQGIELVGFNFVSPFLAERKDYAGRIAMRFGVPLIRSEAGEDYIALVRSPKHGYGSLMNPCIDCRIHMLQAAKRVAEEVGACFIVTGDVLGQRPMSQTRRTLKLEEEQAGLKGLLLRPLTARMLPETVPEREGWVDRERLLGIRGRSRKPQIALAGEFGIEGYRFPDGGCLLTCREFAEKVKQLFEQETNVTIRDIVLLRIGRHYFFSSSRITVGRNERENEVLLKLRHSDDYIFDVLGHGSPIALLEGPKDQDAIELTAAAVARYSDADDGMVLVEYSGDGATGTLAVDLNDGKFEQFAEICRQEAASTLRRRASVRSE
jgi:tRNA-specific 2-thiouridylase